MLRQNRRQCPNHVLNPLVRRQQAECEQHELALRAKPVFEIVGIHERKIGHAVRNNIDLSARNRIHFAQEAGRLLAHHNKAIGKLRNLFQHGALIRIGIAQDCVKRCNQRHLQLVQQRENVTARNPAVDAILMLQADKIVAVEIQELGGSLIGSDILLLKFQAHLLRILVARLRIVDRNGKQAFPAILVSECGA